MAEAVAPSLVLCVFDALGNCEARGARHVLSMKKTVSPHFNAPHPLAHILLGRVLLYTRILQKRPSALLALLDVNMDYPDAWINHVAADLKLLSRFPPLSACNDWDIGDWAEQVPK